MFTGLIEELGIIKKIVHKGNTLILVIQAEKIMRDLHEGDSIAVNGVCLTVTKFSKDNLKQMSCLKRLNILRLTSLKEGSTVNLERAMSANGRFGGHLLQVILMGLVRFENERT